MMDWNGHMTSGGWIFSILGLIIMLALVAGAIIWATRAFGDRERERAGAITPRQILDRRLATGEINAEEYAQLRETLSAPPEPPAETIAPRPADAHVHV